jgi:hypothetical protein
MQTTVSQLRRLPSTRRSRCRNEDAVLMLWSEDESEGEQERASRAEDTELCKGRQIADSSA